MIETFCGMRFDRFIVGIFLVVGIIIGRILVFCRSKTTSMFRECLGLPDSLISPSVIEFLETSEGWGLFDQLRGFCFSGKMRRLECCVELPKSGSVKFV